MSTSEFNAGNPRSRPGGGNGGVEILLVVSCYRNQDKLRPDGPLDSYADFTLKYQNGIHTFDYEI